MSNSVLQDVLSDTQRSYLQNYVNSIVGFSLPLASLTDPMGLFNSLSRKEEACNKHKDQWGNWEGSFCQAYRDGRLAFPYRDSQIFTDAARYKELHPELPVVQKYPNGHGFALCITHDTDNINCYPSVRSLYKAVTRYLSCGLGKTEAFRLILLKALKDALLGRERHLATRDINRFIELEESLGFRSTFYLFAPVLPKPHHYDSWYCMTDEVQFRKRRMQMKELARIIHDEGWDIGLHGSYHSAIQAGCLKQEKESLQGELGFEIQSSRQHWLHFDVRQTPLLHQDAGFVSDSTLGFNRHIGFRSSVAHPHKLWSTKEGDSLSVWQIPLNIMDGTLFYDNALELDEDMAIAQCVDLMERVAVVGGVLTINWHPDHLNKDLFFRVYAQVLSEAKKMNAWGCSAAQLASHWEAYTSSLCR